MARSLHANRRGVALLIVVTILVTMVIVAVPFALSMRQGQQRTEAARARGRAVFETDILCEMVKLFLVRTTPDQEDQRFQRGERSIDSYSTVDSLDEITPNDTFRKLLEEEILSEWEKDPRMAAKARYLKSRGLGPLNDDRGSIWTVLIEDAQARINVNGCSPFLLGNLLGSALLTDDLDTGAGDISVDNVVTGAYGGLRGFPRDGGYIRIGREVISYETFDGDTFHGCGRGVLLDVPLKDNGPADAHDKGAPVIDYTAYKLATHLISRRPGALTPFQNLEALRDIASWGEHGVLTASRLERVLPYLTVWSRRETSSGFLAEQLVVNELPEAVDGSAAEQIRVRDIKNPSGTPASFNLGTILRISDGVNTVYQTVAGVGDDDGRQREHILTAAGRVNATDEELSFKGGSSRVAARAPYPININTAPREVLYAVLANIQLWRAEGKEQIVTPELAWQLAGQIEEARKGEIRFDAESGRRLGGPFRNSEDWGRFLEAKTKANELSRAQFAALYTNAINPHSYRLRFGTAPWCFRTLDVYHIEARVALNNRAGEQIAEAAVREVVEIGSDTTAGWTLDSQDDFEVRLAMGSGAKWVTSYPFAVAYKSNRTHHIQPALRGEKAYVKGTYPSTKRGVDLGDVRLEPARLLLEGEQVRDHFDFGLYSNGHFTGFEGGYRRKTKELFMRKGDVYMRPFSMSFWWRPYSDRNWTVFDTGIEQFENRIGLFVQDGEDGPELTFRCAASSLWQQGAEVYVPLDQLDYEPGTWYHIHVSCDGEDPSSMQLLVDGVDIARRRGLTFLNGSVGGDDTEIPVESTDGFPMRGALLIGREVIEYESLSGSSFVDCTRGARGTGPNAMVYAGESFPQGTPVHVLGYSMPLLVDVMKGGCYLAEELGMWNALRIETFDAQHKAPDEELFTVTVGDESFDITLAGFHPSGSQGEEIVFETRGIWGYDWQDAVTAFGTKGMALVGCDLVAQADQTDDGMKLGGWEIVYYERTDNVFTCTRFRATGNREAEEDYFLVTEQRTARLPWRAFIVPISVEAAGTPYQGEDYLDPSETLERDILMRYPSDYKGWSSEGQARVLLGTDDPEDGHEIIRYSYIERKEAGPGILFVQDVDIAAIVSGFFGQAVFESPDQGGNPGNPPGNEDPPVPGGGVPPGDRDDGGGDPTPGDQPPDIGDPEDPGSEPGTGEPGGPDDGSGDSGDGEPLDPVDEEGGSEDEDGTGTPDEESSETEEKEAGETDDAGGGTGDAQPPEEEPTEDETGGGGDYGETTDEEDDTKIPDLPPPGDVEYEEDLDDEAEDDSSDEEQFLYPGGGINWNTNERAGDIYWRQDAVRHLRFRGVHLGGNLQANGGVVHANPGSSDNENALFLPCFRVREGFLRSRIGRNDVITITDGTEGESTRVEVGVRWGSDDQDGFGSDWVALKEFVTNRFAAREEGAGDWHDDVRGLPRVQKFPCGELPDKMSSELEFGESSISGSGLVTAFLDELHVWRYRHEGPLAVMDTEGVQADAEEVRLSILGYTTEPDGLEGYDPRCGVLQLEGELIIYRGAHTEGPHTVVLERCARGQLGTRATFHARSALGRFLPDVPVSYLESGMTAEASTIPLARTKGWPKEGLARIVREDTAELVHYTRRGEAELVMPVSLDEDESTRDRGLFRGRFGTDATEHDSEEIVVFQPFRYWDRYAARRSEESETFSGVHDHPEASYFELGKKARSAYWRGFTWAENVLGRLSNSSDTRDGSTGEASGLIDVYVLARFSPNVPWDTQNVIDMRQESAFGRKRDVGGLSRDHLFLFDNIGDQPMGQGRMGNLLGLESDTAEFRIYFAYKANAFAPMDGARRDSGNERPVLQNWWKRTPWLRKFTVNYFTRTSTRYRAPLR